MISKISWIIILVGTVVMVAVMVTTGKPLKTAKTPSGIISLELASTQHQVDDVLAAWGRVPQIKSNDTKVGGYRSMADVFGQVPIAAAKKNTLYDFIFIVFYTALFIACCKTLSLKLKQNNFFFSSCRIMAKAAVISALLDVVENVGMLRSLFYKGSDINAMVTATASSIKWLIVFCTIIYIIVAFIYWKVALKVNR